jgi:hypothetical protein
VYLYATAVACLKAEASGGNGGRVISGQRFLERSRRFMYPQKLQITHSSGAKLPCLHGIKLMLL